MPPYADGISPSDFGKYGINIDFYDGWDGPVRTLVRYALIRGIRTNKADPLYDGAGFLGPYISGGEHRRTHITGCPSLPEEPRPDVAYHNWGPYPTRIERAKGYGVNWQHGVCRPENNVINTMRMSKVHRPTELVFMCDGFGSNVEIRNSNVYPDRENEWPGNTYSIPIDRHFDTFSMSIVDGHAEAGSMYERFTRHYFRNTEPQ